ncbi:hypothetical protein GCM10010340_57130 [Streptomyces griseoloalbus]|nr:hypothetical protein GCM10010340_57130 [Streptomyces albaduncus]
MSPCPPCGRPLPRPRAEGSPEPTASPATRSIRRFEYNPGAGSGVREDGFGEELPYMAEDLGPVGAASAVGEGRGPDVPHPGVVEVPSLSLEPCSNTRTVVVPWKRPQGRPRHEVGSGPEGETVRD